MEIGVDGGTATDIAGEEAAQASTIYLFKDGRVRTGKELGAEKLPALPAGIKVLVGYTHGGRITAKRNAYDACGEKWNFPTTLYRLPDGTVRAGNEIRETAIPKNTIVFFRN